MTILEAILQGLIQGVTEFLPVSSSGHLSLFQHFFGVSGDEAVFTTIALHIGTLIAVFIAFRQKIWALILEALSMIKDIFTGKFKWSTMNPNRRMIMMIIISILPLFIFYIFKDFFEGVSEDSDIIVEGICFLYTATILFLSDRCVKGNKKFGDITVKNAVTVGAFQGVALLPGVSRSGSTISGGLFCGFERETAVQYSFILGIPAILGGCLLQVKDAVDQKAMDIEPLNFAVGFIVSAIVGICAIKMVNWLVKSDKFKIFAVYTLILGVVVIGIGIFEHAVGMNLVDYLKK